MREEIECGDRVEIDNRVVKVIRIREILEPGWYRFIVIELEFDDKSTIRSADYALEWDRVQGMWIAYRQSPPNKQGG